MVKKEKQNIKAFDVAIPKNVLNEVKETVRLIDSEIDFYPVEKAFNDTLLMFKGKYKGYLGCNNHYHDIYHTLDVFLAMARIIYGVHEANVVILKEEQIVLGLICALFHDVGYIQKEDEREGTGARFTLIHVERGIEFAGEYFKRNKFSEYFIEESRSIIGCTDFSKKVSSFNFNNLETKILGKLLATADLLGQLADRNYLEKLSCLFEEFKEGRVPGACSLDEMYQNTVSFFDYADLRMETDLDNYKKYMMNYFVNVKHVSIDLYQKTIKSNKKHLQLVLEKYDSNYVHYFKRNKK